nr:N-6 DNA methylase [uncultured Methanobacterium sp.]
MKATPEEVEAVQVFSRQLVEDYGYDKNQIQTRPQFRVKARPSDRKKEYPVDIAVFSNEMKKDDDLCIIVECKSESRSDGIGQLEDYLRLSRATLGVWFNGNERIFLLKYEKAGKVLFEEIPNIPMKGQRIEDIGKFKRKDLKSTHNLKSIFKSIRNFLAGNTVGTTRDEELAKQIIDLVLCKLYDEKFTKPDDIVEFRAGIGESPKDVSLRVKKRFDAAKSVYKDILGAKDTIDLDDKSITYVVGELQNYCLMDAERDAVGDAFEVFVQKALKGGSGQFFTPKNVVKTAVEILDPNIDDKIIDPACGSGGFLVECLRHLHEKIEEKGKVYNWSEKLVDEEKIAKANSNLKGIEKDDFLSKISKAYMIIMGDGRGGIFCDDSLVNPNDWKNKTKSGVQLGTFDIVLTNPPFGKKISVSGEKKLSQYALGHKWSKNKKTNIWTKGKIKIKEAPQILFIERCLDLLKDGGKLGIVLPDGVLSNPSDAYIIQYLMERTELIGLIDLPKSTFLPYTPTKTHLLFLRKAKNPKKNYEFFMSYAKTCGHDKRGKEVFKDEIRSIPNYLDKLGETKKTSHLGFKMNIKDVENRILLPKYYNPDLENELEKYEKSGEFTVKSFGELQDEGIIKIMRGNEIGSENYGTGPIPFIRTSEVANWEIIADPTHCVHEDIYDLYKNKQEIKPEDILIVNDGTYLMGRSAMITDIDTKIIIQSHFKKITVLKKDKLSPHLLLALIGLEIVQRQIESKSFRQGTISTLGNRILEVKIPIPRTKKEQKKISNVIERIITKKREGKLISQNYKVLNKSENLMGIINKGRIGNLN